MESTEGDTLVKIWNPQREIPLSKYVNNRLLLQQRETPLSRYGKHRL